MNPNVYIGCQIALRTTPNVLLGTILDFCDTWDYWGDFYCGYSSVVTNKDEIAYLKDICIYEEESKMNEQLLEAVDKIRKGVVYPDYSSKGNKKVFETPISDDVSNFIVAYSNKTKELDLDIIVENSNLGDSFYSTITKQDLIKIKTVVDCMLEYLQEEDNHE